MTDARPTYCCAILRDDRGRYLLEHRPRSALAAPGQLTCFGGKRLDGEHPDACIRRELLEELGFATDRLKRCLRLLAADPAAPDLAWFYRGPAPAPDHPLITEPGTTFLWIDADSLDQAPLSPWHRAALDAERRGHAIATLSETI